MKDRLGLPIDYDSRRYGYYYTETTPIFPFDIFTKQEYIILLEALHVNKKLAQKYISYFEPLVTKIKRQCKELS
jgi:hypothetical protein